jgi:hypothetical protein
VIVEVASLLGFLICLIVPVIVALRWKRSRTPPHSARNQRDRTGRYHSPQAPR